VPLSLPDFSCGGPSTRHGIAVDFCGGIDWEAYYRYTLGRQTSQGGFCFYACPEWGVEEPNALNTCAAVAIFGLLELPVPGAERCKTWLRALQDRSGGYPTFVMGYAALRGLQLVGAAPHRDPRRFLREMAKVLRLADTSAGRGAGWLAAARRCLELCNAYGIAITDRMRDAIGAALQRLRGPDGGYGVPGSSIPESATALALATAAGLPAPRDVLAYARRCEGAPYGFNITPFAVSSGLESHQAGLWAFRHFGVRPHNSALIRRYVATCQTSRGGFGRVPGAIPGLDDSLRALQILSMLAPLDLQGSEHHRRFEHILRLY
jgi:hypothetical protein